VAIPSLPAPQLAAIAEAGRAAGLHVRYLPSFLAAVERDARLADLRQLDMAGLLGRSEVRVVSERAARTIAGRRVLVTGAGGSIGSELCRQIRSFEPARLYLLDHDESNLHRLQLEITGNGLLDGDDIVIADIRDRRRIDQLFAAARPDVVFHAAAHKHLPLLERHPCEAVKSNVRGPEHVVEAAAIAEYAETFVLDMGVPVPIVALVRNYATQLRLTDVEIRYTGLRPGEKLAEKLFSDSEQRVPTAHPKIWAARHEKLPAAFGTLLERAYAAADEGDSARVRRLLHELVPEYTPSVLPETPVSAGAPYPDDY
jgi:FlaA1/EpsC-like NDP-sugar epimerase